MQNFTGVSKRKPIPRSISRKVVFHVKVIKQRYQNQCLQTHHPIAISLETSIAGFCYMKTKLRIALYEETLFVIQIAEEFIFFRFGFVRMEFIRGVKIHDLCAHTFPVLLCARVETS